MKNIITICFCLFILYMTMETSALVTQEIAVINNLTAQLHQIQHRR